MGMTDEADTAGNGGTVRTLALLSARAILRSKANVVWNTGDTRHYKTPEFDKFVRGLTLPQVLQDLLMAYPRKHCNTRCKWLRSGSRPGSEAPGCAISYGCDCCTCHHAMVCDCKHCGDPYISEESEVDSMDEEEEKDDKSVDEKEEEKDDN